MIKIVVPTVIELPSYEEVFEIEGELLVRNLKDFMSNENHFIMFYIAKDVCIYDKTAGKFLLEKPLTKDNYDEAIRMITQLLGGTIK